MPPSLWHTRLSVYAPTSLQVRMSNQINGSVRSFTYMDAITPIT